MHSLLLLSVRIKFPYKCLHIACMGPFAFHESIHESIKTPFAVGPSEGSWHSGCQESIWHFSADNSGIGVRGLCPRESRIGPCMDSPKPAKKRRRPRYPAAFPYHGRSGRTNSLDRETGSESENATASRGSEVIADSHFEKTKCTDNTDRLDDTINALMARLAPSILKHVEEALLPLVSALRSREENEQKHREKLLGLEMEKLVLERKKLMFKQRRACLGPYRNSPRSNRHKVGVKKNSSCAAQQDQTDGNGRLRESNKSIADGWLRENNKSIADDEAQTSVLRLQAEFDSYMLAEREAQKHDF